MGEIKWYKRDPNAALIGMAALTLEECGAYNLILDLIYARDGHLPDDDRELSRLLHCSVRKWRRIRRRLMDLGKLYIHAGCLHNQRADTEVGYALAKISKNKANGLLGVEKRRLQREIGQSLAQTSAKLRGNLVPLFNKNKDLS